MRHYVPRVNNGLAALSVCEPFGDWRARREISHENALIPKHARATGKLHRTAMPGRYTNARGLAQVLPCRVSQCVHVHAALALQPTDKVMIGDTLASVCFACHAIPIGPSLTAVCDGFVRA